MTGDAGPGRMPDEPAGDLAMGRIATAILASCLAIGPVTGDAPPIAAGEGIGTVGPADSGRGVWSGDRMRGARERLKDILPGRFG